MRALTPADLAALTQVAALRRAGLGDDDLVNVTRTASLAMARIADAVTAESTMWANVMGATDESSPEHVDPLATFDSLLAYLSRRQLLAAVLWRTATTGDDLDWPNLAVGFADIVGYTELSQQLPGDDIAELVGRFDSVTSDVVADGGGRTVKMIGDAVLFTAETSAGACEIALTLSARLHADRDARFPGIRVGLAWARCSPASAMCTALLSTWPHASWRPLVPAPCSSAPRSLHSCPTTNDLRRGHCGRAGSRASVASSSTRCTAPTRDGDRHGHISHSVTARR